MSKENLSYPAKNAVNKAKETANNYYPEIHDIREDLESLRSNVVELTKHVQENSLDLTADLAKKARKRLSELQEKGRDGLKKIEQRMKDKPGQTLATAFAAGLLASFLLARRG